jgi:hypothetical protein
MIKRKANYVHKRPVLTKFISFQSASNKRQKAVNFNSHFKKFYIEFRFEFYIKIKPIESKIIYLLCIFYKLIVLYLKVGSSFIYFFRFVQKVSKTIIVLP